MSFAVGGVIAYLVLGMAGFLVRPRWLCGVLALVVGTTTLALWAPGFPEEVLGGAPWGIPMVGDTMAFWFWMLTLVIHGAVLWHERARPGPFHPLLTLLCGTCLGTALSWDLFNLYVVLELAALLSFLLVGYEARPRAVWAALQYLILATVGMTLYLVGLGLVYGKLGTLSLTAIASLSPGLSDPTLAIGVGLLLGGAAVKSGLFLYGLWLPQAHGYAPTGVSAVLSGLVVKMGVVALARIGAAFPVGPSLVALGIVTGFGGLAYALWEPDIKLFLAYHTVSQLGYVLLGLGIGGPARYGAVLYAVAHGLFKGLLFLAAGEGIEATGEREIRRLAGRMPGPVALGLAMGSWAIAGIPPLAGFVAKEALGGAVPPPFSVILTALSLGTAASFSRLLPLFRGKGKGAWGGMGALALGVLGFGLWGLAAVPKILHPAPWIQAGAVAGAGYLFHLGLHRLRPNWPRITLDRGTTAILVGTAVLTLGLLLAR